MLMILKLSRLFLVALKLLSKRFVDGPASLAVDNRPDIATCSVTNGKNVSFEFF